MDKTILKDDANKFTAVKIRADGGKFFTDYFKEWAEEIVVASIAEAVGANLTPPDAFELISSRIGDAAKSAAIAYALELSKNLTESPEPLAKRIQELVMGVHHE